MDSPISVLPGLAWPAIPIKTGAVLLSVLFQVEESQWWPAEKIAAQQFRQLQDLLTHAARTIPFYRDRFIRAGLKPVDIKTQEQFGMIPPLTRSELQEGGDALLSRNYPKSHGATYPIVTSGSTGAPVKVYGNSLTGLFWKVYTIRDHVWHQRDLSGKLAAIRAQKDNVATYPQGVIQDNWGSATEGLYRTGPSATLNIKAPVPEQAEWLCRQDPVYLISYPSNILQLAKHFSENGLELPNLREVRTLGEILKPEIRQICREVWNVPVVDTYSSQEIGYIALQCPEHEHYHVMSENILVEILNDDNLPCKTGEIGRIVVTSLHNYAMPLIRYDIGDYAEAGGPCPCGRGLPVLNRILGRQRQMFTLPDGSKTWPDYSEARTWVVSGNRKDDRTGIEIVMSLVRQFQVVQRTLHEVELRLVADRPLTPEEESFIIKYFQDACHYPFEITFNYLDAIPRGAGEKFEDFKSDLA